MRALQIVIARVTLGDPSEPGAKVVAAVTNPQPPVKETLVTSAKPLAAAASEGDAEQEPSDGADEV